MSRRLAAAFLLPTLALLAATRLPRTGWTALVAGAALVAALLLGVALLRASPPRWTRAALKAACLVLFLVPPSPSGLASGVPAIVPALALLLTLDALHAQPGAAAPALDGAGQRPPWVRRALTIAAIVGALLLLAPAASLLPARLADTLELHGVELPLLAGAAILVPVLVTVWVREALRSRQAPELEAQP